MGTNSADPGRLFGLVLLVPLGGCLAQDPAASHPEPASPQIAQSQLERMVMPPALPRRVAVLLLPDLEQLASAAQPVPVLRPEAVTTQPAAPPGLSPVKQDPVSVPQPPPTPPQQVRAAAPTRATEPNPNPNPTSAFVFASAREGPRVQLVAAGSEAEAMRFWARITQQVPELTEGRSPYVLVLERADLPTIWRLRVGGFPLTEEAEHWCAALRARGHGCWVSG